MNEKLKKLFKNLNAKYRLIVLNDITLEEKLSFRLSRMNVYVVGSTLAVILVCLTAAAIVFTPLKEYIPGYQDVNLRRNTLDQSARVDSLSYLVAAHKNYIEGLKKVLKGETDTIGETLDPNGMSGIKPDYANIDLGVTSHEDSLLREEQENVEIYELFSENKRAVDELSDVFFSQPLEGQISDTFNLETEHFGLDLVGAEDAPVKSVLGGVVILNEWSVETGYIIGIQHPYNLVSFYKHNSVLLKKVGTLVQAGDVIAIVGDSGELSEGPHLHFELWHNQAPVNPLEYIIY